MDTLRIMGIYYSAVALLHPVLTLDIFFSKEKRGSGLGLGDFGYLSIYRQNPTHLTVGSNSDRKPS